ncbi:MAG: carboxy terminal-processing peptidase [Ignavibacterium sp.]|nr:carboxy terminal-processing peptidase [Ignavibacterium sp.]MDW8374066.1 carboxy terminal-processing peptidase [Ignavibacteriales bacterium]
MKNKNNIIKAFSIITLIILISLIFAKDKTNFTYATDIDSIKVILPEPKHKTETRLITSILTRYHYKKFSLNDSLSSVIFDEFINNLDNSKSYFLLSDIKEFEKQRYNIDDMLMNEDIDFFFNVYNRYVQRVKERVEFAIKTLENEIDFSSDDYFIIKRDSIEWSKTKEELDEDWFKRIKNDALIYKLNGKDWDFIKTTLQKRYKNLLKFLLQNNSDDVFQLAMNSFAESIDPHTNYFSPVTSDNFKIEMSLSLEGIGARLQTEDDYTKIFEIIPGGPADKSKELKPDDKIIAVAQGENGEFEDVIGWRLNDVVSKIRGEKGTVVRLLVIPAGESLNSKPKEVKLVREKVKIEDQAAKSKMIELEQNGKKYKIGVIEIPRFYTDFEARRTGEDGKSTTKDVKRLIEELKSQGMNGLIIDLRNNGGGALNEAVELTGLFINYGPVVQVRNSMNFIDINSDTDSSIYYNGPLAVLINRFSASASEIFASAIQDYGRGLVIGENSYGKGTVQNLIDLNVMSPNKNYKYGQVKLTVAKFYRINGETTQKYGAKPDIEFPSYFSPDEFGEANQKSALQPDKIKAANYKKVADLSKIIPELRKRHQTRVNSDPEFEYLIQQIEDYRNSRNTRVISLNEEKRKKEQSEQEEKKFVRENNYRKKKGLELLQKGDKTNSIKEIENEYPIRETGKIIIDYIALSK